MKRFHKTLGLGLIALAAVPLLSTTPVWAQLQQATQAVVENLQQKPQVQLQLSVAKKVVTQDTQGQPVIQWEDLGQTAAVKPGDSLRYRVTGNNAGDRPVSNFIIQQPIPAQLKYVLNTAEVDQSADVAITYSIDGGKTFVAEPVVQVTLADGKVETRPAPAEVYTNIRWEFAQAIAAQKTVNATYQLDVR